MSQFISKRKEAVVASFEIRMIIILQIQNFLTCLNLGIIAKRENVKCILLYFKKLDLHLIILRTALYVRVGVKF
jgi:hypothetical protein